MADRKILFLDIDGVLNSAEWMKTGNMGTRDPQEHFDPVLCARLESVLAATKADVVLSSTWRRLFPLDDITKWIRKSGVPSLYVIDKTPIKMSLCSRGEEIGLWLQLNQDVHNFAIVDDDDDMRWPHLVERFVNTTWEKGLQDEHVDRLIELLNNG